MDVMRIDDDGPVRTLHMVDEAGHNALDEGMVAALVDGLRVTTDIRVVVLRGLPEVFSRGASADVLNRLRRRTLSPGELVLPRAVLAAEVPVIAAMEGHAIGGGFVLGLCADVVILAEDRRYGATFTEHGFTPGMGATCLLERVMSPTVAHELLFTAEPKRGRELAGTGCNYVLPPGEVWPRAREIALRIADKPRRTLTLLKAALAAPWRERFERAHALEAQMHAICFESPEATS